MKTINKLILMVFASLIIAGCSNLDNNPVEANNEDVNALTKMNPANGTTIMSQKVWDKIVHLQ